MKKIILLWALILMIGVVQAVTLSISDRDTYIKNELTDSLKVSLEQIKVLDDSEIGKIQKVEGLYIAEIEVKGTKYTMIQDINDYNSERLINTKN